jgi:hypothetical protein
MESKIRSEYILHATWIPKTLLDCISPCHFSKFLIDANVGSRKGTGVMHMSMQNSTMLKTEPYKLQMESYFK